MAEIRTSRDEDDPEFMLHTLEANVGEAYLFFKSILETDTKKAPEFLVSEKLKTIETNLAQAADTIDRQFQAVVSSYNEDEALGRIKKGQNLTSENRYRLMKASTMLMMLVTTKRMVAKAKINPTIALLSILHSWSEKLLLFSKSIHAQPIENLYIFYHYDASPHFRVLCESCGFAVFPELKDALAQGWLQDELAKKLGEKAAQYYEVLIKGV